MLTNMEYGYNPDRAPRLWNYTMCAEGSSQFFWTGTRPVCSCPPVHRILLDHDASMWSAASDVPCHVELPPHCLMLLVIKLATCAALSESLASVLVSSAGARLV